MNIPGPSVEGGILAQYNGAYGEIELTYCRTDAGQVNARKP